MSPSSTWIVWSTPSARVRMLRCGWVSASSAVISPSITMRWTSVWSSVTCVSSPPRRRYARESPTCTRCTRLPSTRAAVSVVPMPETLRSFCERSNTARLASATCSASEPSWRSNIPWTVSSARLDATSPPRCPPIPSATAYRGSSTRYESSLPSRTWPMSVVAPTRTFIA